MKISTGIDERIASVTALAEVVEGLALNDYGELQKTTGADQTAVGVVDQPGVSIGFGLPEQNGDKRGGIQDRFGRPCSS